MKESLCFDSSIRCFVDGFLKSNLCKEGELDFKPALFVMEIYFLSDFESKFVDSLMFSFAYFTGRCALVSTLINMDY